VNAIDPATLDWAKAGGLLPAIIQDVSDGAVLMLGYMNREALEETLAHGEVVFFSRARQRLWRKGETSGNVLSVVTIDTDCDRDTLRVRARPAGPVCHLGTRTCFDPDGAARLPGFLGELEDVIRSRLESAAGSSYVAGLAAAGRQRIAQKVGEEGVEAALAFAGDDREAMLEESADLLFHLMVGLATSGLSLSAVLDRLAARHRG
jgi:phosphoribosyl-ATP pyrophosphohydrolase/phosphoribosyl-AMP cyclohydrolase